MDLVSLAGSIDHIVMNCIKQGKIRYHGSHRGIGHACLVAVKLVGHQPSRIHVRSRGLSVARFCLKSAAAKASNYLLARNRIEIRSSTEEWWITQVEA